MIWTFHFTLNEAIVRKGGKSLVRCSPLKLNERRKESCWQTSIFVNFCRFIYSSTSWKLMPNDLGQPLYGKIRNNWRFEHDILDNKSKRARCAGFDLRLSKAVSFGRLDFLHHDNHIDTMTEKWLLLTQNPPRITVLYTLTKIHKPNKVGRPIISGCEGPTERISSFLDYLLQPIAKAQKSNLKDTTDFINFIEKTKVEQNAVLVSMDVTSLYTNIPQEEGIATVCNAYETFHKNSPPIPTHYIREMLNLILKENSFEFNGKHYLQTHGTAMGTRVAVAFANIFMSEIETEIILHSSNKPLVWKRYIDDIFSLWNIDKRDIGLFLELANNYHPTIKFTAEISDTEITFLDTYVYKGERFKRESILDVRTHFKPTETFQYTEFTSCHPPGVWKGFIQGEALRLLRTNSKI